MAFPGMACLVLRADFDEREGLDGSSADVFTGPTRIRRAGTVHDRLLEAEREIRSREGIPQAAICGEVKVAIIDLIGLWWLSG